MIVTTPVSLWSIYRHIVDGAPSMSKSDARILWKIPKRTTWYPTWFFGFGSAVKVTTYRLSALIQRAPELSTWCLGKIISFLSHAGHARFKKLSNFVSALQVNSYNVLHASIPDFRQNGHFAARFLSPCPSGHSDPNYEAWLVFQARRWVFLYPSRPCCVNGPENTIFAVYPGPVPGF